MNSPSTKKETLAKSPMSLLLVITGPTASGKDTIIDELLSTNMHFSKIVSYTTRCPRQGEVDGIHGHYISEKRFQTMMKDDQFLETVSYGYYQFGTDKDSVLAVLQEAHDVIWKISVERASTLDKYFAARFPERIAESLINRTLVIFLGVPRLTVLKDRFFHRAEDIKSSTSVQRRNEFLARIQNDWKLWQENSMRFKNVIINSDHNLNATMTEIQYLIERYKRSLE